MRKWRRIYARDASFRSPPAGTLRHALHTLNPHALWLEALSRENAFPSSSFDVPVATAAVRPDPADPTQGYLTLLHFVNDRLTLATLLEELAEVLYPHGVRTLQGPTNLFPFLGGGALSSHWHLPVPTDTPYGPPYAGEHLGALLRPLETLRLYHLETTPATISALKPTPNAVLRRLEPLRLATDLLPLLQNVALPYAVTRIEAETLLNWLRPYRPAGFTVAAPDDPETPVGFVLLYGAANPRTLKRSGRLWGGVGEEYRRQGLSRALIQAGLNAGRERGWQSVSIGPVPEGSGAVAFLQSKGGVPLQRYTTYQTGL